MGIMLTAQWTIVEYVVFACFTTLNRFQSGKIMGRWGWFMAYGLGNKPPETQGEPSRHMESFLPQLSWAEVVVLGGLGDR